MTVFVPLWLSIITIINEDKTPLHGNESLKYDLVDGDNGKTHGKDES